MSTEERSRLLTELGTSGLYRHSYGYVHEEFLSELAGLRGIRTYREMADNDPVVGAELFAIEQVILSTSWNWQASSEKNSALRARDFFAGATEDMSHTLRDALSEALTMLPFGWAFMELVYKMRRGPEQQDPRFRSKFSDGLYGWRKWALRSQETLSRWEFDEEGGIKGLVQVAPPDFTERAIAIEKALLFRTRSNRNDPEGRSILRNAFRPWYYGKRIEEVEAIGIERDLAGLPVATPPADYDMLDTKNQGEVELVKHILRNIRRDEQEGILKPPGWELTLLSTGGRRQIDTDTVANRYNKLKAMTVLAQFMMLGMEKVGSFSLALTHEDLFLMAVQGWCGGIADTINRHAVPRLGGLNGIGVEDLPRLEPAAVREPKVAELGKYIADLVQAGAITTDEPLEDHLRAIAKLPQKAAAEVKRALKARLGKGKRQVGLLDLVE